ncbi:dirigent protein 22-like [Spinacia oleracea]|uniref:Dirigent protein n=1 Tax=Spinacia oleracea TaxID=3562 RepID=A0ABM3QLY1_SPIOL|nr:dirigent protein 22-like [Spinacia oleracea]
MNLLVFTTFSRADWPETSTWAKTERYGHEHKTVLQFYFHEISIGESSTIALIAQAKPADPNDVFPFGNLYMADEFLTVGPKANSTLIGRAQSFSGSSASQEGVNSFMGLCYSFVNGVHNGSSFNILGRNSILNPIRELPFVGGTRIFRMARGYAMAQQSHLHGSGPRYNYRGPGYFCKLM